MRYAILFILALSPLTARAETSRESLFAHETCEDEYGVIAPWYKGQNGQLDERIRIAVDVYKRYPWVGTDKAVMAAPDFIYNSHWSITEDGEILIPQTNDWMCGDLSQRAWSIIKGLTAYYRYSGDPIAFLYIPLTADYVLDYGLTPEDHPWPRFPIATPTRGKAYGQCLPDTRIQLDLCARLGEDILEAYKLTGDERYYEAAKHWADVFASHANLDPEFPPWNRYADPSVVGWSDKLTGSVTMILEFLDAVIETGYTGQDGDLLRVRDAGRAYVRNQILPNWAVNENWGRQYWDWDNPIMCGIVSMCGDYILQTRGAFPNWRNDMRNVLTLVFARNGADAGSRGDTYSGAWAFPESATCCGTSLSYNQYTAAPTLIRYGVLADDPRFKEIGRRMMLMATYDSKPNGVVKDGVFGNAVATGEWSNLAHPWPLCQTMEALKWMPETFGPARENHIMQSSSVVNHVVYGDGKITYSTFDAPPETVDVLRLSFLPTKIIADGVDLELRPGLDRNGYTIQTLPDGDCLVRIRHDTHKNVQVEGDDPQQFDLPEAMKTQGPWTKQAGGSVTTLKKAHATHTFSGNQVRMIGDVGPEGGLAEVYLDGEKVRAQVDFWNPKARERQVVFSRSGLEPGEHTLEIVALGKGNPLSQGTRVTVAGMQHSAETAEARYGAGGGPTEAQRMIFGYISRKDYVDHEGHAWRPATEFVSRSGYGTDVVEHLLWTNRRTMYIGNTEDEEIYRYGAHGDKFWTNVTVGPGLYDVRLHFASTPLHPFLEKDKDGGWKRYVLHVDINGKREIEAMDVAEEAGATFTALTKTVKNVAPKHGVIEVLLTGVDGREAVLQALEVIPVSHESE